ncbi:MAG: serine protease [Thermodesulfobacteriota bacterium]|nr:serine protease [Thermodesulfobacteriota bacterium]
MMVPLKKLFPVLWVAATVLPLCACTSSLIKPDAVSLKKPAGIQLPAQGRLAVLMAPQDLDRKYRIQKFSHTWQLDEGLRIQSAAVSVFGRLFQEALPFEKGNMPHLVARVSGVTHINPIWGKYGADASLWLYYGNGDFVGEFQASGSQVSQRVNDSEALEKAYVKAFAKMGDEMLENEKLSPYFRAGFTDDLAGDREPPSGAGEGPAPVPQERTPTKYDDFLKSVIMVRTDKDTGTGFFISANGFALTDYSVVKRDSSPGVRMNNGLTMLAKVVATDKGRRMALLKVNTKETSWLKMEDTEGGEAGSPIVAIGGPGPQGHSISKGIIRTTRDVKGHLYVETDASLSLGSAGTPLISRDTGKVVGMVTSGIKKTNDKGLHLAISGKEMTAFIGSQRELIRASK